MTDLGRHEEVAALGRSGETISLELKSKRILMERRRTSGLALAAGVTAMANRRGGQILIGVDNATKTVEPGNIEDRDAAAEWISRVCQDRCSPPIIVEHEYVTCPGGEVLVLKVPRRRGVPHAVVGKMEGGVAGRAYYVRTNSGKQLATEAQLGHMFQNTEFPELEKRFVLGYVYDRPGKPGSIGIPTPPPLGRARPTARLPPGLERTIREVEFSRELFPEPPAMFHVQALLQGMSSEGVDAAGREPDVMMALLRDVFPYAVINYLSWRGDLGWATESEYGVGVVSTKTQDKPHVLLNPGDVPAPGPNSILSRVNPNFADRFRQFGVWGPTGGLRLPPGTEVGVEVPSPSPGDPSTLSIAAPGRFSLTLTTRGGPWNVGIPLGHPLRRAVGAYTLDAQDSRGTVFASVCLQGSADIGGTSGEDDHYGWMSRLAEGIRLGFDYGLAQKTLPDHHILRIEMMVSEILARLQGDDARPGQSSQG